MTSNVPAEPSKGSAVPIQGYIERIRGQAEKRGMPEASEIVIRTEDGTVLEAGLPQRTGVLDLAQSIPVPIAFRDFGTCPICLDSQEPTREHVPADKIGGKVLTMTCGPCNNTFGNRYEPNLETLYNFSLGRVRISGEVLPGKRVAGEWLRRETSDGQFVLIPIGKTDRDMERLLGSGDFCMEHKQVDETAVKLAAVKHAYLVSCLVLGAIPLTPRADAIRSELVMARDCDADTELTLTDLSESIKLYWSWRDPKPGEVDLVVLPGPGGTRKLAIRFHRIFAMEWPLEKWLVEGHSYWRVLQSRQM